MNSKIKEAIAKGEAVLAEKKRLEEVKKQDEEKERQRRNKLAEQNAKIWAEQTLPRIIEDRTKDGIRYYRTNEPYYAGAAREIGLEVTSRYVDLGSYECYSDDSYTEYTIHW